MRLIEQILRSFNYYPKNDIYFHECGHAVLAGIFSNIFIIDSLILNEKLSKQYDPLSSAGLKGHISKPITKFSIEDHDAIILIMLAGLCADDINNSDGKITEQYYRVSVWSEKFQNYRYSGDFELISSHFFYIRKFLVCREDEYFIMSIRLLHNLMLTDEVWNCINCLRRKARKSPTQVLSAAEITLAFDNCGLRDWINNNIVTLRNERSRLFMVK